MERLPGNPFLPPGCSLRDIEGAKYAPDDLEEDDEPQEIVSTEKTYEQTESKSAD